MHTYIHTYIHRGIFRPPWVWPPWGVYAGFGNLRVLKSRDICGLFTLNTPNQARIQSVFCRCTCVSGTSSACSCHGFFHLRRLLIFFPSLKVLTCEVWLVAFDQQEDGSVFLWERQSSPLAGIHPLILPWARPYFFVMHPKNRLSHRICPPLS